MAIEGEKQPNTTFLMNRAQCYYDQKKFKHSILDLEKAHEASKSNP